MNEPQSIEQALAAFSHAIADSRLAFDSGEFEHTWRGLSGARSPVWTLTPAFNLVARI